MKTFDYTIYNVYRPPESHTKNFYPFLDQILYRKEKVLVVGDMNLNVLKKNTKIQKYRDIITSNYYKLQNTKIITRRKQNHGSVIDHLITPKQIRCKLTSRDVAISDHKLLFYKTNISEKNKTPKTKKLLTYTNYNKFRDYLTLNSIEQVENFDDFLNILKKCKALSTTTTKMTIKHSNYWFNYTVFKQIKKRDKIYRLFKKHPNEKDLENNYKRIKNETNYLIRKLKSKYIQNKVNNCTNKNIWKTINQTMNATNGKNENKIENIILENETLTSPSRIVNSFNEYFTNVSKSITRNISQAAKTKVYEEITADKSALLTKCKMDELETVVKSLKNTPSTGEDGISSRDIKEVFPIIKNILLHLINDCFKKGYYPDCLKISKILPLYKKGSRKFLSNYRPISLCSTVSKIIEKIVKNRLTEFFKISPEQYGFQSCSSTLGAVVDLNELIIEKTEKNLYVTAIFIDLQKAFDTVDHNILLDKLYKMGIQGPYHLFFRNYLQNRKQFTLISDKMLYVECHKDPFLDLRYTYSM